MVVDTTTRIKSGIAGLDEILHGGFLPGRAYLVTGGPGTGKTIFGLQFLMAGPPRSSALFISFTETEKHLREHAASLSIRTESVEFLDLTAEADVFTEVLSYDIFSPSEVEREPISTSIRSRIDELSP